MVINWNVLEAWMKGKFQTPLGLSISYEFRPSLHYYVDIHTTHLYWQTLNPTNDRSDFWLLSNAEQRDVSEEYLKNILYKQFKVRPAWQCLWQRFYVINANGEELILQMDSKGKVDQLKRVTKTIKYDTFKII